MGNFQRNILLCCLLLLQLSTLARADLVEQYLEVTDKTKVCMVNDFYNPLANFSKFKAVVNNKTYYGCCAGCMKRIAGNEKIRMASDPFTKETVDKAEAYIVADLTDNAKVLYFKNKASFNKFIKANS